MKKNILLKTLITGLSLVWFSDTVGQILPAVDGAITIKNLALEEKAGKLVLSFETEIAEKAMNYRQSWRIIPELSSPEGDTLFLPSLLINETQKERHYKRRIRYKNRKLLAMEPVERVSVPQKEVQVISYKQEIPYKGWMEDISLTLHQLLTSSKEKKQLFTYTGMARLPLEEKEVEPMPMPAFPVLPDAKPQLPSAPVLAVHGEAYINFEVGKAVVIPELMNNQGELKKIEKDLRQILGDKNYSLVGILLTGYASPEGSLATNERLSEARTKALKNYISEKYAIEPERIGISHVPEDWGKLRTLVEKSQLVQKSEILSIIHSGEPQDSKEKQLRTLQPAWNMLISDFFRCSEEWIISYCINDLYRYECSGRLLQPATTLRGPDPCKSLLPDTHKIRPGQVVPELV
ncbi:MAG: DUF3868 domain-containing protein [Bacteroides sp.]|nr:DUF3868 domain-containing protein [Bacteroides sp.]